MLSKFTSRSLYIKYKNNYFKKHSQTFFIFSHSYSLKVSLVSLFSFFKCSLFYFNSFLFFILFLSEFFSVHFFLNFFFKIIYVR